MKIAVAQLACRQDQPHENFMRIAEWAKRASAAGSELIIFPELFNTGCAAQAIAAGAIRRDSAEMLDLCDLSKKFSIAIIAGFAEKAAAAAADQPDVYNSCIMIEPEAGIRTIYRKAHLCPYPPFFENLIMKAGEVRAIVEYRGLKIGLTVCFDLRFPELYRALAADGCELIINCASWPRVRLKHWEALLTARAIENQTYIAAANQVGSHKDLIFAGRSKIIDPLGEVIVEAGPDSEEMLTAEVNREICRKIRKTAPVLELRRKELY